MKIMNKNLLEDCKREHSYLISKITRFIAIVETMQWTSPQDVRNTFGRHADQVKGYWIIDIGGKKGARVLLVIQFDESVVIVQKIWTDHNEYMQWSKRVRI